MLANNPSPSVPWFISLAKAGESWPGLGGPYSPGWYKQSKQFQSTTTTAIGTVTIYTTTTAILIIFLGRQICHTSLLSYFITRTSGCDGTNNSVNKHCRGKEDRTESLWWGEQRKQQSGNMTSKVRSRCILKTVYVIKGRRDEMGCLG